jgi:hypothetical protein
VRSEGLGIWKTFIHLIGSRTRDILACTCASTSTGLPDRSCREEPKRSEKNLCVTVTRAACYDCTHVGLISEATHTRCLFGLQRPNCVYLYVCTTSKVQRKQWGVPASNDMHCISFRLGVQVRARNCKQDTASKADSLTMPTATLPMRQSTSTKEFCLLRYNTPSVRSLVKQVASCWR